MSDKFDQAMEKSVLTREAIARLDDTLNLLLLSNERIEAILETFRDFVLEVSPAQAKEQIQELEHELSKE
tara:strand:+ start:1099 stop:1308 length:210 start_codon:yes stop_codon:yes gene_type:complete